MTSSKAPYTFLSRSRVCALSLTFTALLFGAIGCQTSVTPLSPNQPVVITEGGGSQDGISQSVVDGDSHRGLVEQTMRTGVGDGGE